jgi:threonyl-tRNA synthetase
MAIHKHYPKALPTIGPVTETGFYYDVDFGGDKIGPDDLAILEKEMRAIVAQNLDFKVESVDKYEYIKKQNTPNGVFCFT